MRGAGPVVAGLVVRLAGLVAAVDLVKVAVLIPVAAVVVATAAARLAHCLGMDKVEAVL